MLFKIFKKYKTYIHSNIVYFNKNNFFLIKKVNLQKKLSFFPHNIILRNLLSILFNLFSIGYNFIILDKNYNYNYLPVDKKHLNYRYIYKTIKYFNVKALLFLNLKHTEIKKFLDFRLLNITVNSNITHMDFFPKYNDIKIIHYILYIYILGLYLHK